MLLVSSLDVFDCCGLELGGECLYPDPNREEDGRGDSGMIFRSLLGRPGSPSLPRNVRGQGTGGKFGLLLGTPTNPALAPSLYPESNGQTTGTGTRTLALTQSLGSLRTLLYFGDPLRSLHGHPAPRGTAQKIQETGQPSPTLLSLAPEMPRAPPPTDVLAKRRETLVEEGSPALAFSPFPFPGAAQEGLMSSDH